MRSFAQIFELVRADLKAGLRGGRVAQLPDDAALLEDFRPACDVPNTIERLLLRAHAPAQAA